MKVLLIQPPHNYEGGQRYPEAFPLGLGYIAKVLMDAGHRVDVLDIWAKQYSDEEVAHMAAVADCDVIGISAISTQYAYTKWLVAEIKKTRDTPVVIGNALATLTPEIVMEHTQADVCVIGEGEITFKNVIDNLGNLESVKGIHFKQDGEIVKNKPQEYIKDLDSIDFPMRDIFPMDVYLKNCRVHGTNIPAMNLIAGRGCPYSCRFCSKTFAGLRLRSVDNIVAEIKMLIGKYGIKGVAFSDELVVINKDRMLELCDKIEPLEVKWSCQGRSNLVDYELLKRMKEAGCVSVGYGVESGSQAILENMNKRITVEQSRRAIEDTVKIGMRPLVQLMYGYPGENDATLRETTEFLSSLPYITRSTLSITTPLPGSELWDYAISKGLIKDPEKYLAQLAGGYAHDAKSCGQLINFTNFTREEFFQRLNDVEMTLFVNKLVKHPYELVKDYFGRAKIQHKEGGMGGLVKRVVRFIKWVG